MASYSDKKNVNETCEVASQPNQQSTTSHVESSGKKRKTEGTDELNFKLFKFPETNEQYLLEMHKGKTGEVERSKVRVHMCNRKWKVSVSDLVSGSYTVIPILEDPISNLFVKKYPFTLQERLVGWTVEIRMRSTGREDKYYYHRKRQFRSLVEVTTFILYSTDKVKDLKHTNDGHDE